MNTRTWPYGTLKKGWIVEILHKVRFTAILIEGDDGEGYCLFQAPGSEVPDTTKSHSVVMEFTEGGPTGGYWKIVDAAFKHAKENT
jgi:hypothetical protein